MKTHFLYLLFGISAIATAQNFNVKAPESSVSFHPFTFSKTECIPELQRQEVNLEIEANKTEILLKNPDAFQHRTTTHPLFILPFKSKDGFDDYGYYSLFNQVDHDPAFNGNLLDYNCGPRSYDWATGNHKGTDYVVWPYPWLKMEENVMEIIAAAPGVILQKRDGNYDRNCDNTGNPNWNGIILEHADGSRTWYWHFKDGSTTSKNIGDSVVAGEYLGRAGSSGSSDIPHVHFEVYNSDGNRIDPYAGDCNSLNTDSWWIEQPDYFVPEVLSLSTHNTDAYDIECGVVEDTYEELNFVPGETVRFRIFYRDIENGANTYITVLKPNGVVLYDYVFTSEWPTYFAAWAQWLFPIDANSMDGVYTVNVNFGSKSYQTKYGVNTDLGVEDLNVFDLSIYPNPTVDVLNIEGNIPIEKMVLFDVLGRNVLEVSPMSEKTQIDLSSLIDGVYFLTIISEGKRMVRKIVKE